MKPWFSRFRHYPLAVLGHILWGMGAGYVGGLDGLAILSGGYAYQFGSAWRKMRERQRLIEEGLAPQTLRGLDSVGMDSFDYAVGYAIGYSVRRFLVWPGILP